MAAPVSGSGGGLVSVRRSSGYALGPGPMGHGDVLISRLTESLEVCLHLRNISPTCLHLIITTTYLHYLVVSEHSIEW